MTTVKNFCSTSNKLLSTRANSRGNTLNLLTRQNKTSCSCKLYCCSLQAKKNTSWCNTSFDITSFSFFVTHLICMKLFGKTLHTACFVFTFTKHRWMKEPSCTCTIMSRQLVSQQVHVEELLMSLFMVHCCSDAIKWISTQKVPRHDKGCSYIVIVYSCVL